MSLNEMVKWAKIPRLDNEQVAVSEKLDGTSVCVYFDPDGAFHCQSRNRIVTPDDDNYGFARWVSLNAHSLFADLGPGYSFGEWWGQGIQRRYDMPCKVFSLFDTRLVEKRGSGTTPNLAVVPLLYYGALNVGIIRDVHALLMQTGSQATEPYTGKCYEKPEGVVARLILSNSALKLTDMKAGEKHA